VFLDDTNHQTATISGYGRAIGAGGQAFFPLNAKHTLLPWILIGKVVE